MLGDLSTRTGIAVRSLAGLQLVAKQSDTSIEALGKGINKLGIFMVNNAADAKKLGLSAKDPLEAFIQLSATISKIPDVQLRNAAANQALGKSYEELLPALLQGPEALRRQIENGQQYNKITQAMADEAKKFKDSLDLLGVGLTGVASTVAGPVVTALNILIEKFRAARAEGDGFWKSLRDGFVASATTTGTSREAIEDRMEFLGRRKNGAEKLLGIPFFPNKEAIRKDLAGIEAEIRASTARLELLNRETYGKKPPQDTGISAAVCRARGGVWANGECEIKSVDTGLAAQLKSNADYVKSLQEQAALLGLNAIEAERFKAAQRGLNAEERLAADIALTTRADFEAEAQHRKDLIEADGKALAVTSSLKDRARAIADQLNPQLALNTALQLYGEQLEANKITQEEYNTLFDDSIGRMVEQTKTATDEMSEFAKQGARNMQSSLADFLFDPFEKGLAGMAEGFLTTLRRMTAEAAASQIFDSLGGNNVVGSFISSLLPGFADGGVHKGGLRLVGERGPEIEYTGPSRIFNATQTKNMLAGSDGGNTSIVINVDANGSSVQGNGQNAAELGRRMGDAVRSVIIQEKRPGGLLS